MSVRGLETSLFVRRNHSEEFLNTKILSRNDTNNYGSTTKITYFYYLYRNCWWFPDCKNWQAEVTKFVLFCKFARYTPGKWLGNCCHPTHSDYVVYEYLEAE